MRAAALVHAKSVVAALLFSVLVAASVLAPLAGSTRGGDSRPSFASASEWTNVTTSVRPPGAYGIAMTFDQAAKTDVLAGGCYACPGVFQTSLYNASSNTWTQRTTSGQPWPTHDLSLLYIPPTGEVLLFGGGDMAPHFYDASINQTWSYDVNGDTWADLGPTDRPPGLLGQGLVYDTRENRTVLFGGCERVLPTDSCTLANDTWEYDPAVNRWTNRSPAASPSRRANFGMAYDSQSALTIVFGGRALAGSYSWSDETWVYNFTANAWTQRHPSAHPSPRGYHSMVYDDRTDLVVLYGGLSNVAMSQDTWVYDVDRDEWRNVTPATGPGPLARQAMAYDPVNDVVVLFGGIDASSRTRNETWVFRYGPRSAGLPAYTQVWVFLGLVLALAATPVVVWAWHRRRR